MPERDAHRGVEAISAEEAQREDDLRHVEATMMEIGAAVRRAERAREAIARAGRQPGLVLALDDAIESLHGTRRTLQQQAYFGGNQPRIF